MSRTVKKLTIGGPLAGRDQGKTFIITEMAARPAHTWATRAIFAMMNHGAEIPADVAAMGVGALVMIGIQGLPNVPYETAAPLLDELLECAAYLPDANKPDVLLRVSDSVVEEMATYFALQNAAWDLISAPFTAAARSISASDEAAQAAA